MNVETLEGVRARTLMGDVEEARNWVRKERPIPAVPPKTRQWISYGF